jgi:hypothetical protein
MGRGPGKVERMIEAAFLGSPDQTFSTDELVALVFPTGSYSPSKAQRVSVLRAADKVAKRLGNWEKRQCGRSHQGGYYNTSLSGRGAVYVNVLDLHSYAIGLLRTDFLYAGKSLTELESRISPGG